jgi:hypothetical protein
MKPKPKLLFTICCMAVAISLLAQSQKKDAAGDDKSKEAKPKPKAKSIPVYLGKSNLYNGEISKHLFDSLVLQGVTCKDSAGKIYTVTQFGFTYAERNLYEDSVGNSIIVADYLADICFGDTLNALLKGNIPERSKPGDTVFFDGIIVKSIEGYNARGKAMKFILTK